ncbi:MAG: LysR family transcriptional regulator [Alphaproteobacteria bacterium]
MKRSQLPFSSLRAFEVTAKQRSFKKAADILCVTQSAVSRHVSNLESILGVKLFERHHQGIELTEAGKKILPSISSSFDIISEGLKDLLEKGNRENVRLNVPPTFGNRFITPIIGNYIKENPDVNVEISADGFYGFGSLESGADLAIIFADKPPATGYLVEKLRDEYIQLLCTPEYAKKIGYSDDNFDWVEKANYISTSVPRGSHDLWATWEKMNNIQVEKINQATIFATSQMSILYAMQFDGISINDPTLFKNEINDGKLVPLGKPIQSHYSYYIAYSSSLNKSNGVAKLKQFIEKNIKEV